MRGFLLRTLVTAAGLWLAHTIVPGIVIASTGTLVLAALLMGLVNALVRPLLIIVTLPITLITLGLFVLVINAAMFGLVAAFLDGFSVSGFFSAFFGWLIVALTSTLAAWLIGPTGRYEVMVVRRQ